MGAYREINDTFRITKEQGFPKEFKLPDSNTKAYQQFGNSVAVPVVEKVSEQIVKQILEV